MNLKVNIKTVIVIIITSSVIGLVFNYFYSKGIPIIRIEKKIEWTKDSIFQNEIDSLSKRKIIPSTSLEHKNKSLLSIKETEVKKITPLKPTFITLKQAYNLYVTGKGLFIDARDKWEFAEGHIAGAINIPEYSFENSNPELKNIPKNAALITYCGGDDCEMSTKLAENLFILGYKKVFIFFGGWNEWLKAGYPVEKE